MNNLLFGQSFCSIPFRNVIFGAWINISCLTVGRFLFLHFDFAVVGGWWVGWSGSCHWHFDGTIRTAEASIAEATIRVGAYLNGNIYVIIVSVTLSVLLKSCVRLIFTAFWTFWMEICIITDAAFQYLYTYFWLKLNVIFVKNNNYKFGTKYSIIIISIYYALRQ